MPASRPPSLLDEPAAPPPVPRTWRLRAGKGGVDARDTLSRELGLRPVAAQVLVNRGVLDPEAGHAFLSSGLRDLPDPRLLSDMEAAGRIVAEAVRSGSRIVIHGDYDVDGVTSSSLLHEFLSAVGARCGVFVPHRERDGYGLAVHTVERLAAEGQQLIITCDNGSTAHREIELARKRGMQVVVCDHHTLDPTLPDANALLNPKRDGREGPFWDLAAVGVAFLLAIEVRRQLREGGWFQRRPQPDLRSVLDIVALGTVADMAPLRGVNRTFVRVGLQHIERRTRPGIAALLSASGVRPDQALGASVLGFKLGPRINAAGRLESAEIAVELLLTRSHSRAGYLARTLDQLNKRRQELERRTVRQALELVADDEAFAGKSGLLLADRRWHPGVIGIVAARMVERYHRPTVILAIDEEGTAKGSGRSIPGVDLHGALCQCAPLLSRFGGHRAAAGMTLDEEQLPAFRERFEQHLFAHLGSVLDGPSVKGDGELELGQIDAGLLADLARLGPFGLGNPEPVFFARGVPTVSARRVSKGGLSLVLGGGEQRLDAIAFSAPVAPEDVRSGVDVAFAVGWNNWRGQRRIQLRIRDLRPAGEASLLASSPR